jgi:hypothetical protein
MSILRCVHGLQFSLCSGGFWIICLTGYFTLMHEQGPFRKRMNKLINEALGIVGSDDFLVQFLLCQINPNDVALCCFC